MIGVMTSPDTPAPVTEMSCCGQGGSWAPKAGEPLVAGCALCSRSSNYWRRRRADGRTYEPVKPLGDVGR